MLRPLPPRAVREAATGVKSFVAFWSTNDCSFGNALRLANGRFLSTAHDMPDRVLQGSGGVGRVNYRGLYYLDGVRMGRFDLQKDLLLLEPTVEHPRYAKGRALHLPEAHDMLTEGSPVYLVGQRHRKGGLNILEGVYSGMNGTPITSTNEVDGQTIPRSIPIGSEMVCDFGGHPSVGINPLGEGYSGSAILDRLGRLVGILTTGLYDQAECVTNKVTAAPASTIRKFLEG